MDISRITDDSAFKKKENNIQQYISLIQDQKFFERMRQDGYKDRNLLKNLGQADSKPNSNPYSSKYGKSKSVSWRETGREEQKERPLEMSDQFGNESELEHRSRNTKNGRFPEIPHNDSKVRKREEFLYVTQTRSSQQSETRPARKEQKQTKSQDRSIGEVKPVIPDDTRSEGHWNLPSISKNDISIEKPKDRSRNHIRSNKELEEDQVRQRPISAIKHLERKVTNKSTRRVAPEINLEKLGETDSHSEDTGTAGNSTKRMAVDEFYDNIKRDAAMASYTESSQKPTVSPMVKKSEPKVLLRLPTVTTTKREAAYEFYDEIRKEAEERSESKKISRFPTITTTKREAADEFYDEIRKVVDENSFSLSSKKQSKPRSRKSSVKKQKPEVITRTYTRTETFSTDRREVADDYYEAIKNQVLDKTLSMMNSESDKRAVEDYYNDLSKRTIMRSNTLASNLTSKTAAEDYYNKLAEKAVNATFTEMSVTSGNKTNRQIVDEYWEQLAEEFGNISIGTEKQVAAQIPTVKLKSKVESLKEISAKAVGPIQAEKFVNATRSDRIYDKKYVEPKFIVLLKEVFRYVKPINAKERKFISAYQATKAIERVYFKAKPGIYRFAPHPLEIRLLIEETYVQKPKPKIQTMKNLVIDSELANKALETYTYKALPRTLPPPQVSREIEAYEEAYQRWKSSNSDMNKKGSSRMFITEIGQSPGSHLNYSQREIMTAKFNQNKASIDDKINLMNSKSKVPRDSYDKSDRFKVPHISNETYRGPIRNSLTDLQLKNSNNSLERGINLARDVRNTGSAEERPSVHNIYGNYSSGLRDQFNSEHGQAGYYTANDMNRIRDQIKASIQGMFDLKRGQEDSELTTLIGRFYHLIMDEKNTLSRDKADIVIDLVSFYMDYIKNLREETKIAVHSADIKIAASKDERERNRDLQREINHLRVELKDAHEDKLEAVKKMNALDFAKRKNEGLVREIEQKYEDNIEKFKDLLRNVNEEFLNARKHEIQITDRLNGLKREYDQIYHENISLKSEITGLDFKDKERQFEVERVMADLRNQITKNQALLRERDVFAQRIRQYQERMAELESVQIEIENYKAKAYEANRNVESLRSEVRNKDLVVMDLQHRVNYNEQVHTILREENTMMISNKEAGNKIFNAKMNDMEDNMFAHDYHKKRLQQSSRTIKKDANETIRHMKTFEDDKAAQGVRHVRNPIIHSLNSKATDGLHYNDSYIYTPTVRGKSAVRQQNKPPASESEIKIAIQEYNAQLYHYQDKKVILDSMLCRLPANPKSAKEMQLKESLDSDYTIIQNKISEYKKLLRDLRAL